MTITSAVETEMSRVPVKGVRSELQLLKKWSATHRSDISALKHGVTDLENLVKQQTKGVAKKAAVAESKNEAETVFRFTGKGLAAQRKRLGLSAAEMGTLLGCSGQSVYKWEQGTTRPRASQMPAIAALRRMGKKEAAAKLAAPEK